MRVLAGTPPPRAVLHIDMDCFYCQVEHNRLGISREEPLAVVQWSGLIAVNYPARAAGISRHDNVAIALQKCPNIRLVHVEYIGVDGPSADCGSVAGVASAAESALSQQQVIGAPTDRNAVKACLERYRTVSSRIFAVLKRHCPACEKGSLDEAYLDCTEAATQAVRDEGHSQWLDRHQEDNHSLPELATSWSGHVYSGQADGASQTLSQEEPLAQSLGDLILSAAAALCAKIRQEVWSEVGIRCSAGIAHNKILAKLASAMHKPNDQTVILWRGVAGLFSELPTSKIKGLGGKLGEQIRTAFGATTCGEVVAVGPTRLAEVFSESTAAGMLRLCSGHDDEPVADKAETKSMLAAKSFEAVRSMETVQEWLA